MKTAIVTGSAGLIGSEAARALLADGYRVIGIDNNLREYFFGAEASTAHVRQQLAGLKNYQHESLDIRDRAGVTALVKAQGAQLKFLVHAAAQPSHDWAAREPHTDFEVNALGTLNLLEAVRLHARDATFAFMSTNKVYGDRPNALPLVELETRWEVEPSHPYRERGIDEGMSIDQCTHSLFGASKASADLLVQEYGRYFGMATACFRGGCLTGPQHAGAKLHGFLAYLMKCCIDGTRYTVCGYKAKQVRDNIHSHDLVAALRAFHAAPRVAEVYNIGGGRQNNCSMLEAIALSEKISGNKMNWGYDEKNRVGDHIWWVSDTSKFERHYPAWRQQYTLEQTLREIFEANRRRAA